MCLLCNEVNAVAKEYNLRRHYTTTHETFDANYPPGSDLRKERIKKLKTIIKHAVTSLGLLQSRREELQHLYVSHVSPASLI